jgi:hypothetical protein
VAGSCRSPHARVSAREEGGGGLRFAAIDAFHHVQGRVGGGTRHGADLGADHLLLLQRPAHRRLGGQEAGLDATQALVAAAVDLHLEDRLL